jgi:CDP-diacylglycerol--serine O-phosphatidyltransferase
MNYKLRRLVPNSISSLSLVLGVLSIFMSIEKDFFHAALFIVLAMIADSLDGRAARFLGVAGGALVLKWTPYVTLLPLVLLLPL